MMFQGFNMLTIARIGGHSSLDAQMHYFNHLEYFSQSSIQYLSDQYRKIPHISLHTEGISNDNNIKNYFPKLFESIIASRIRRTSPHGVRLLPLQSNELSVGDCRYCEYFFIPIVNLI